VAKRQTTITDLRTVAKNGDNKWERSLDTEKRGRVHWRDAGPEDLRDAVAAVTEDGAALLLAVTSDGGALVIQVLTDAGRHKLYPASMAELNEALRMITEIATEH